MIRRCLQSVASSVILVFVSIAFSRAQRSDKKYQQPKPQVLPLPSELPMAVTAETDQLDFHISPLRQTGGLSAQIRQSLNDLIRDTHGETIVKLRAFVAGTGDARRVQSEAVNIFSEHKLQLPVVSIVQVGGLESPSAQVVMEAVVSTRRAVNPAGLAFMTNQFGATLADAVQHLRASAQAANVSPDRVLSITCFTSALGESNSGHSLIGSVFPKSQIDIVQALRDPVSDATVCEAVGQLSGSQSGPRLTRLEAAHTVLVGAQRLVFTGLQLCFGSFLDDAQEANERLRRAANVAGAEAFSNSAVQIDAFSLTPAAGAALRKKTSFPVASFTVVPVEGLTAIDATAGIDAILALDSEASSRPGR